MPSYVTAKKNTEFVFYTALWQQADTRLLQNNPTIAAGDFKVSTDGGAFANPATLPAVTPASGRGVKITLSAAEMNGDNIFVYWSDAAGAQWGDDYINIQTSARQIDDLAYVTGGTALTLTSGAINANVTAAAANVLTASALATDAVNEIADGILARSLAAESYAADGAVPTLSQILYMLLSKEFEAAISGTTITAKKLDGTTTSMTFTLAPDGTNPTSITRAT